MPQKRRRPELITPAPDARHCMRANAEEKREETLRALHSAWSAEDLDKVLGCFATDVTYLSNKGEGEEPLILTGKDQLQAYLAAIVQDCECSSHIRRLTWREGALNATIGHIVRHRATGHELRGTFRQLARFRGYRIHRLEEYYDAAKIKAFVRLTQATEGKPD
jgi:ketosteroid isomerase-like protein